MAEVVEAAGAAEVPYGEGAFVAHAGTDVYGPGKVLRVEGELRRVRFVYFVATIAARDLRQASGQEERWVREWLRKRARRYGGRW